jgi:hypothetical protein
MKRFIGLLLLLSILAIIFTNFFKDPFLTANQLENVTLINGVTWFFASLVGGIMLVRSK